MVIMEGNGKDETCFDTPAAKRCSTDIPSNVTDEHNLDFLKSITNDAGSLLPISQIRVPKSAQSYISHILQKIKLKQPSSTGLGADQYSAALIISRRNYKPKTVLFPQTEDDYHQVKHCKSISSVKVMNLLTEMVQAMIYGFIKVPLQAHHRILIFEKMDVSSQSDSKIVLNSELPSGS